MAKSKAKVVKLAKKDKRIKTWSPSAFSTWKGCARRAFYKHVEGRREEGGAAMERGNDIHEVVEGYVAGRRNDMLIDGETFIKPKGKVEKLIKNLRKKFKLRLVRTELFLAFDSKWKRLKDGSNANPNKWMGLKIDAVELERDASRLQTFDWKTGKLKKEGDPLAAQYDEQIHLYNVAALSAGLPGKSAASELVFTDADERVKRPTFTVLQKDLREQQVVWEAKVEPMLNDRIFAPKPSNACRWCPYSVNNDGPCEF